MREGRRAEAGVGSSAMKGLGAGIVVKWDRRPGPGVRLPDMGLEEVVAAQTKLSDIDGKLGRLSYVGYDIHDLATDSTFEEVVYLLQNLALPTAEQLDELTEQLVSERDISGFLQDLMPTLAKQTSPMSMLRTSVSAASAYDPDGWDQSP